VALLALVAGAAPATASATWENPATGAPATVSFEAVSVYRSGTGSDDVVVAVGRDSTTGQAVIYRHAGGQWLAETATMPSDSCLVSVSVTAQAAWAVGSQHGGCTGSSGSGTPAPLIVRFAGGGEALKTPPPPASTAGTTTTTTATPPPPPSWQVVPDSALTGVGADLRTVSLVGSKGFVGNGGGALRPIDDGNATPVGAPLGSTAPGGTGPAPATVRSVAVYPDGTGVAVGTGSSPSTQTQIFDLSSSGFSASKFTPDTHASPLVAVAATSASSAIALEHSTAYWEPIASGPNAGFWQRVAPIVFGADNTSLAAVSMVSTSSGSVVTAVAGDIAGQGAVWRRTGTGGWSRDDALGAPLHGVAAVSDSDMWAVGPLGTIIHYYPTPPPPTPPPPPPPPTPKRTPSPSSSSKPQPTASTAPVPPASAPLHTTVDQPPAPTRRHKPGRRPRPARRLLTNVRVQVQRGRLVITFVLSRRARVAVTAGRAGRTVGGLAWKVFAPGRRQVIVPFVGPGVPAQLRISARPATRPRRRPARRPQ